MAESSGLLLLGFKANHKLEEALKKAGDKSFFPAEEVAKILSPAEVEALIAVKKRYWTNGEISASYLAETKGNLDLDILKNNDPKSLPKDPEKLERMLSEGDIRKLNESLGVTYRADKITDKTREAVVADKRANWVNPTYTQSVQKALNAAEKEHAKALEGKLAIEWGLTQNKKGIVSGEDARKFANTITDTLHKAQQGDAEAIKRLQKLDTNFDGRFDSEDVARIKQEVRGAFDKSHLDRITGALGGKSLPVTQTDGPTGAPLPNMPPPPNKAEGRDTH